MRSWLRPNLVVLVLALVALTLLAPVRSWAHGDAHEAILALTKEIDADPKNPQLYLRRGELNRAHQEWDLAHADYEYALILDPGLEVINFVRGRLFFEANWLVSAKISLDRFLARYPRHVEALTTRARTLVKLGQRLPGAQDYSAAITNSAEPLPELYIERAQALTQEGGAHLAEALQGLDEGIKKLGPVVTLQLYAIDLEMKHQRYDNALARLETVASKSPRQETWLARRGEILRQAGRENEARDAFKASLKAIDRLPPARRSVPAMVELQKRVQEALQSAGGAKSEKK
jgi:tetratricopeptide (TPR) repeat protein